VVLRFGRRTRVPSESGRDSGTIFVVRDVKMNRANRLSFEGECQKYSTYESTDNRFYSVYT
jgi:hypothetical protein